VIGKIASAFYPNKVIVPFYDFTTNEYANLFGGSYFEPKEEKSYDRLEGRFRILIETYRHAFGLECVAMGVKVGICGQGLSDFPDLAAFLVYGGIGSIPLHPIRF
jgi:phosphoenolpyruvate synthase/pyruvate phosphate dikinase